MRVLELILDWETSTNVGKLFSNIDKKETKVVTKNSIVGVDLNTYDMYLIRNSFLSYVKEEELNKLFDYFDLHKEKKVYIIFDEKEKISVFLNERYDIEQSLQDSAIIDYENYEKISNIYKPVDSRYLFCSNSKYKNIKIYKTNKYFIVHIENISFIIDTNVSQIPYSVVGSPEEMRNNIIENIKKILDLFNFYNVYIEDSPEWAKETMIFNEEEINNKILAQNSIILKASNEIESLEQSKEKIAVYKKLLFANSDELRLLVIDIIEEIFGEKNNFVDKNHEDYLLDSYKGKKIFFEIKGENNSVRLNHISQCESHVRTYAADKGVLDSEIKNLYKGVLIYNPFVKKSYKDRIRDNNYKYSDDVIKDAKIKNICVMDTATLLNMYIDYKKNILTKEAFFDILLNEFVVAINHSNIKIV